MKIKNIIFDFGGVLIDWDPRYMYKDVFKDEVEMESFLTNVCDSQWNVQQDAGRSFADAIDLLLPKYPQYAEEIKMYHSNWLQMIKGAIMDNVALLEDLKTNYRLFGLTNWSAETFPLTFDKYSFFKVFEGIVVSGEEKLIKPDAKIYNLLLSRYELEAKECLFIDDNFDNIKAADALGFSTIHLDEGVNLKTEFAKLGI